MLNGNVSAKSWSGLSEDDGLILPNIFNGIEGWLWPDAGWFTTYLINQSKCYFDSSNNAVVEFGTYKGKYLSLLYYLTRLENSLVLGVDIFKLTSPEEVTRGIASLLRLPNMDRLNLIKADTKLLDVSDLEAALRGVKVKFVSIDAEHTAQAVFNDLSLAQEILAKCGIIAIDDYTNVHCPGVTEGVIKFLLSNQNKGLAPFASCCNKLFLTTQSMHEFYLKLARSFVDDLPFTKSNNAFFTRTASQNFQSLCNYPLYVISHVQGAQNPDLQRVVQCL